MSWRERIEAIIAGGREASLQALAPLAGLLVGSAATVAGMDPATATGLAAAGLQGLLELDSRLQDLARDKRIEDTQDKVTQLECAREDLEKAVEQVLRFVQRNEDHIEALARAFQEHVRDHPPSKAGDIQKAVSHAIEVTVRVEITVQTVGPPPPPVAVSEPAEIPDHFCDRPYLIKERILPAVEEMYEKGGYVIIRGGPGTGKSALIWHLEQYFAGENGGRPVPCFYIRRGRSQWDQANVILRALLDRMMPEIPPDEEHHKMYGLMARVMDADTGDRHVILLDALDELDKTARVTARDILPTPRPGWVVIATTRPDEPLPDGDKIVLDPDEDTANAQEIVADTRRAIEEYWRIHRKDLNLTDKHVRLAIKKAEGNWLFTTALKNTWSSDIERGVQPSLDVPRGLVDFGPWGWDHLAKGRTKKLAGQLYRGLGLLAAAAEPLTLQQMARILEWEGVGPNSPKQQFASACLMFLNRQGFGDATTYALCHTHFRDFIESERGCGKEEMRGFHGLLAQRLGDWRKGKDDPEGLYALRHLPTHLREAGLWSGLCKLLGGIGFAARKAQDISVFEVVRDYQRVLSAIPKDEVLPDALENVRQVCATIDRNSHVIKMSPDQLAPILRNDFFSRGERFDRLRSIAEAICVASKQPWLARSNHPEAYRADMAIRTLTGHEDCVRAVALSEDGKRVVSGANDETVKVWDAETGELCRTLTGHEGRVIAVALSGDWKRIVSGSWDETVKVWDAETGELCRTLTGHRDCVSAVAISGDGKRVVSDGEDKTVKVWDAETGELCRTLTGHGGLVNAVALSGDGKRVVSGSWDNAVKVWDAETGELRCTLTGHKSLVVAVALSGDGKRLVSSGEDKTVRVWDAETGEPCRTLTGYEGCVEAVALSGDKKRVVSGGNDNTIKVWDADTGKLCRTLTGHEGWVMAVALSGDGKRIVSGGWDETVKVWDAETGELCRTFTGHKSAVTAVALSGDGKRIVSGSWDNAVKVWDAETGELCRTLTGHEDWVNAVVLSGDGKRVVSGGDDKTVKVWDAETGELCRTLTGHEGSVRAVAISHDERRVVSGGYDETVRVWAVETGEQIASAYCHAKVQAVAFSPDGKQVWAATDGGATHYPEPFIFDLVLPEG